MSVLNGFHPPFSLHMRQSLTIDLKSDSFLDVLIIRNGQSIETCLYRKPTDTEIRIHRNSFPPIQSKRSTLKTLVYRSYLICSSDH